MKGWMWVAAPLALVAGAYWYFESSHCSEKSAYAAFQKEMAQYLKAPSTAIYQPWNDVGTEVLEGTCIFRVSGYVESQNSFGAMGKTTFSGQVLKQAEGGYAAFVSLLNGRLPGL